MKKKILFLMTMLMPIFANAYDFEVDGIFYNITSIEEKTVEVTFSPELNYQQNKVIIPSEVDWNEYHFVVKGISPFTFCKANYPNKVDTLIISKGVEYIKDLAFQSANFSMISIPNTIVSIGHNAFGGLYSKHITDWYIEDFNWLCESGLFKSSIAKDIYINNVKLPEDLAIPDGVKYISKGNFAGLNWIKSIKVSGTVEYIDANAFGECANLKTVEIEEGVKEIFGEGSKDMTTWYSTGTFANCYQLETVILPSSISFIGEGAFSDSPNLKVINCYINDPFPISSCFSNGQYLSATLNIPFGTIAKYQSIDGWKNFVNIVECLTPSEVFHTLYFSVSHGGHILCNNYKLDEFGKSISVKEGEDAVLQLIPDEGFRLSSLAVDGLDVLNDVSENKYIIKEVKADVTISASFEETPIALTIQHADNGYLKQFVQRGTSLKFIIVPAEGWKINTVVYNNYDVTNELNNDNEYTTPAIFSDAMLSISFELIQNAIHSLQASNVKIYSSNGQITVCGAERGNTIYVYDEGGYTIAQTIANGNEQKIAILAKGIYIVKVNGKTIKVCI